MVVRITPLLLAVACPPRSSGAIDASVRSLGGGAGVGRSESGHAAALQEISRFDSFCVLIAALARSCRQRERTTCNLRSLWFYDVFSRAQRLKPHLLERDPTVPKLKEMSSRCAYYLLHPARALRCRVAHAQDVEHNLPQPGPLGSRSPSVLVNPKPTAFAPARRVALRFYYSPLIKRQC